MLAWPCTQSSFVLLLASIFFGFVCLVQSTESHRDRDIAAIQARSNNPTTQEILQCCGLKGSKINDMSGISECFHRIFNRTEIESMSGMSVSEIVDSSLSSITDLLSISSMNAWRLRLCTLEFHHAYMRSKESLESPVLQNPRPRVRRRSTDVQPAFRTAMVNDSEHNHPTPGAKWSLYDVQRDGPRFDNETWEVDEGRWRAWWPPQMWAAARYIFSGINQTDGQSLCPQDEPLEELDFPVFVLSLERRPDRRDYILAALRRLGFTNVTLVPATPASDAAVAARVAAGDVAPAALAAVRAHFGPAAVAPYVTNALDRFDLIARASAAGYPLFAVFEDDVVPGACPAETGRRVAAALRELPPAADLLYLEACWEACGRLRYSARRPRLARAAAPACYAATVLTARGAARVAALARPVTDGGDLMLAALVARGLLEAYVAVPGLLFQDGYWGSDTRRKDWDCPPQARAPPPRRRGARRPGKPTPESRSGRATRAGRGRGAAGRFSLILWLQMALAGARGGGGWRRSRRSEGGGAGPSEALPAGDPGRGRREAARRAPRTPRARRAPRRSVSHARARRRGGR